METGKHVYCQKPLTHTIYEARKITEAARKYKVQTQMGNQGHSSDQIRLLKEWLADGAIGKVTEVYGWTDRPVGGAPWSNFAVRSQPKDTPPVPATLDWDLWLGPVAYRPYHPEYHPLKWRACKDGKPASSNFNYGGALTEMALLGMVAIRAKNQLLRWDSEKLQFKDNEAASKLLHIAYRDGWHL